MIWYEKIGGRKFIGVILSSLIMFITLVWSFIIDNSNAWNYLNTVTTTYFMFLAAYSGLQIWQKKIQKINDDEHLNKNSQKQQLND